MPKGNVSRKPLTGPVEEGTPVRVLHGFGVDRIFDVDHVEVRNGYIAVFLRGREDYAYAATDLTLAYPSQVNAPTPVATCTHCGASHPLRAEFFLRYNNYTDQDRGTCRACLEQMRCARHDLQEDILTAMSSPLLQKRGGFVLVRALRENTFRATRKGEALPSGERVVADFTFVRGNTRTPDRWEILPPPTGVTRTAGDLAVFADLLRWWERQGRRDAHAPR